MNTQRLLSVNVYKCETGIFRFDRCISKLISKYAVVFEKSNINDVVKSNFTLFREKGIEIPYRQNVKLKKR